METSVLRSRCKVNKNFESDTFVGVKMTCGDVCINFPLGFSLSEDDNNLRKEILLLLNVLSDNTNKKQSEFLREVNRERSVRFPVQAYMAIISDFLSRGLYREQEVFYEVSKKGKINWKRTINSQKIYEQNGNLFYMNFVTKRNGFNENGWITLIHEYLVYESFLKIGWLYTDYIPPRPSIKWDKKLFLGIIQEKLSHTNNDKNIDLFSNMIKIIESIGDEQSEKDFDFGTDRFEYVWESLIDKVYGIPDKLNYFPKTVWNLSDGTHDNAYLKPDTIMKIGNDIFVLDAKYYKYGYTKRASDLPESTSINKQITYAEYVYKKKVLKTDGRVYNAFLMPFDRNKFQNKSTDSIISIGTATSEWKDNELPYQNVVGIMIDVKYLMEKATRQNYSEMLKLSEIIKQELKKNMDNLTKSK